jgi:diguanylate cyclase (GGDEF)-like protein/PAS domain S-box-containing protein
MHNNDRAGNDQRHAARWAAAALLFALAILVAGGVLLARQIGQAERDAARLVELDEPFATLLAKPAAERGRDPARIRSERAAALAALQDERSELSRRLAAGHTRLRRTAIGTGAVLALSLVLAGLPLARRTLAGPRERAQNDLVEIFNNTPDFVVQTDSEGRIGYMNPAMRRALGIADNAPLDGHRYAQHVTPQTSARFDSEVLPRVRHDGAWVGEAAVLLPDGRSLPVNQMIIAHRTADGQVPRYSALMRDISIEVSARQQLQLQTATLRSVIEAIPAMVAVFDTEFRYRLVNKSFERWRGMERDQVVGHNVAELFGQAEHDRSWPWAQRALAGETVSYEKEYPESAEHRHVNVSYIPLRLDNGEIHGVIAVAQDITRQREETARLLRLSERDALTGLLNRAGLANTLQRSGDSRLALLYIDLDHFKPVNDNHGHPVGDEVLRVFARRLQALVRPTDAVARLGGDEFAIVLHDLREPANAYAVADKVVDAARTPFTIGGLRLTVGASVGVAFHADGETGWTGLMERADAMVYAAKAAGRGRRA